MRYIPEDGRIVWSASDLKAAAECEFAWLRAIDARLGRVSAVEEPEDLTLERAGRLGMAHEKRVLEDYLVQFGGGVVEIDEARSSDAVALAAAVARTDEALASDADVIYQAAFSTPEFVGFADFLVRDEDRRWAVSRRRALIGSNCSWATAASAPTRWTICSRCSRSAASGSPHSSPTAGS